MKQSSQSDRASWRMLFVFSRMLVALLLILGGIAFLMPSVAWAQDNSLGNVARQSRAQKENLQGPPGKAQALVDEMEQEQEEAENAPVGFRTYNAGDYKLRVPFPYELEGRENEGAVLL